MTELAAGGAPVPSASARVLCWHGSPRAGGNTDLLLEAVAAGVNAAGGRAQHLYCRDLEVGPCTGCGACAHTGQCVLRDAMSGVYAAVDAATAVVVGSPVYFLGPPSTCKAVIDRFQPYWARRYLLGQPPEELRPGALVATCGAPSQSVFGGVQRTVEALFEVIGVTGTANLLYPGIDARGEIGEHPTAIEEAEALGQRLASAPAPSPALP